MDGATSLCLNSLCFGFFLVSYLPSLQSGFSMLIKLESVYITKRNFRYRNLRAKINGRAHWCGKQVFGTPFWITRIDSQGEIEIRHQNDLTGQASVTLKLGESYSYEN